MISKHLIIKQKNKLTKLGATCVLSLEWDYWHSKKYYCVKVKYKGDDILSENRGTRFGVYLTLKKAVEFIDTISIGEDDRVR